MTAPDRSRIPDEVSYAETSDKPLDENVSRPKSMVRALSTFSPGPALLSLSPTQI